MTDPDVVVNDVYRRSHRLEPRAAGHRSRRRAGQQRRRRHVHRSNRGISRAQSRCPACRPQRSSSLVCRRGQRQVLRRRLSLHRWRRALGAARLRAGRPRRVLARANAKTARSWREPGTAFLFWILPAQAIPAGFSADPAPASGSRGIGVPTMLLTWQPRNTIANTLMKAVHANASWHESQHREAGQRSSHRA